jgi:hypothetical protein
MSVTADIGHRYLDVDGNDVGHQHHEEQLVLERTARGNGRLVVVGVNISHTDDGAWAEELEEGPYLGPH